MSHRDQAVLNNILDPNNSGLYFHSQGTVDSGEAKLSTEQKQINKLISKLEQQAIATAEAGNLSEALSTLSNLIQKYPHSASLYNNRAQVYRLLEKQQEAFDDIAVALRLCRSTGHVALQAFNQRASLHMVRGDEGDALNDYRQAAQLGSTFAQSQLVAHNPYAAMCNSMLGEVLAKLRCS